MSKAFHLHLAIGPGHPVAAHPDLIEALTSVEINQPSNGQGGCQISFQVGRTSRINRILLPAGFFDPKVCRVRLALVVGTKVTPLFEGVVSQHDVAPSDDGIQLTLTCLDLSALMDTVDLTGVPMPPVPLHVMATIVLAPYASFGVRPAVVPTPVDFFPNLLDRIPIRLGTDLAFVKHLAEQTGYIFNLTPGPDLGTTTGYWGPKTRVGLPQPSLKVGMDAETNVESLSFTYDGEANYVPLFWQMMRGTNAPVVVPIPSSPHVPLGARPAPIGRVERIKGGTKLGAAEAVLEAYKLASSIPDAITGKVQLDVVRYPHVLRTGSLVGVQGAGYTYDGLYEVESVTHSIKRGEYKQTGTLKRNHLVSNIPRVPA